MYIPPKTPAPVSTRTERARAVPLDDTGLLPMLFGTAMAALGFTGLLLASRAEDDYAYVAGLSFAAFSLFMFARYQLRRHRG